MRSQRPAPDDRGNLQVIILNLNGTNATIQDALRTVDALAKRESATARRPLLDQIKPKKVRNSAESGESEAEAAEEDNLYTQAEPDAPEEADVDAPASRATPRKNRPTVPKTIPDLNLNGASPTFREFAEQKGPTEQWDWYLVLAYWLKHHLNTEEVGINHVYTASNYIGADFSLPDDVGQPFRDMRRKSLFIQGTKKGLSKITHNGEDRVKKMGKTA